MGVDLGDFFRGERAWPQLGRLLSQLPWHSNYRRALQDDPEVARAYAAGVDSLDGIDGSAEPQLAQWDVWRELAADIRDALHEQTVSLVSSQIEKGKPRPKFRPVPRPKPAMQRELKLRERELESRMEGDFLGLLGGS